MLSVENIAAGYGRIPVLHDLSLRVARNESVAIIGANGAGKSTLVRAISGLLPVTAGAISIGGERVDRMPPHQRVSSGVGTVLETRNLFGELSVRNNLELALATGRRRQSRTPFTIDSVIELFPFIKMRIEAPVSLLSGGEQQMVAIARALLLQPDLLILDEPSTGLAPKVLLHIAEVLKKLRALGIGILLVEQNVAFAAQIADRAYVISLGKVVRAITAGEWAEVLNDGDILEAYLGGHGDAATAASS
ncbi:ABC transporter ATP-binding protein [Variovorax sp. GB1P17]|uniref:ABC transporter ATP-binding protein n=1 Tax=Variovorax sp. GB1P17 TaxID=3443740 RepID=UPI003F44E72B